LFHILDILNNKRGVAPFYCLKGVNYSATGAASSATAGASVSATTSGSGSATTIEVALAEELPEPGDAFVSPDCLTEVGTGVETHGAELVTDEFSSIATGASLTEEHGTSGGTLDKSSNDQESEWEDKKDDKQGEGKVKGSFCHPA